jgi:H+/gluconate symporter-like permease
MLSVVGILLGLALLVVLALKDWNIIIASLLASTVVIVFSGVPLKETLY